MIINKEIKDQILQNAKEASSVLESLSYDDLIDSLVYENQNTLIPDNPENISNGLSGIILVLLELYNSELFELESIKKITDELVIRCKKTLTNNYSLYNGRGGVIYSLIQLYGITKDKKILEDCLDILPYSSIKDYLNSDYTSDYVFDGRTGTLLIIFELYLLTEDESLLSLINLFLNKILSNSVISEEGISWKSKEEINLKNSCGFAYGVAGIKYVFEIINQYAKNPGLEYSITQMNNYINSCLIEKPFSVRNYEKDIISPGVLEQYKKLYTLNKEDIFSPKSDLGWSSGTSGILVSGIQEDKYNSLLKNLDSFEDEKISESLFNGLSGLGILYLSMNKVKNNDFVAKIELIIKHLLQPKTKLTTQGGLFYGDLGKTYFLLKTLNIETNSENILAPFKKENNSNQRNLQLDINLEKIKTAFLSRYFNRTILVTKELIPRVLNKYLQRPPNKLNTPEIKQFISFIEMIFENTNNPKVLGQLKDVYSQEKKRYNLIANEKRTNLQIYLDGLLEKENAIKFLNSTDEWLINQDLKVSEDIYIENSSWNWEYFFDKETLFFQNLNLSPKYFEFLLMLNSKGEIIEYYLGLERIILHHFEDQMNIGQAINLIKEFCDSQSVEDLVDFSMQTGSRDIPDFLSRLDFLVIQKIRHSIFSGVLKFESKVV